jgi:hypothetical protein
MDEKHNMWRNKEGKRSGPGFRIINLKVKESAR